MPAGAYRSSTGSFIKFISILLSDDELCGAKVAWFTVALSVWFDN